MGANAVTSTVILTAATDSVNHGEVGHNGGPSLPPHEPINPEHLYRGPFVDRVLAISPVTRWRLAQRGLLNPRRPMGPNFEPRYIGAEILKFRDAT
jgi:hypothetical protein